MKLFPFDAPLVDAIQMLDDDVASIKLYPSITEDVVVLKNLPVNARLLVIGLNGQLLKEVQLHGQETTIEIQLSHLPAGFYFLKIQNQNGIRIFKILKL